MMLQKILSERTEAAIEAWLADRIAEFVRQPRESIVPDVPLSEYGLDSVYALTLTGEIEDYLGLKLDPTIMWDFPTLRGLTTELFRECQETIIAAE